MTNRPSVLLIFGTSHVGKSTLANRLGEAFGWQVMSIDSLARHPGRPWPEVKAPVAEYYSSLSDETISWFPRAHHENMWPLFAPKIREGCAANKDLVLEGSALRPEFITELDLRNVVPVGLHAGQTFLKKRMDAESGYHEQDGRMRLLIDKFILRSPRDNEKTVEAANRLGLRLVDVGEDGNLDRLAEELIGTVAPA